MTPLRLKYIEVFQALMETGSTHGAAEALHTTQPSVSKALAALERQLGFPLFLRTPTGMKPTADANKLMTEANRITEDVFNFQRLARELHEGRAHHITVQASPTLTTTILTRAVAIYKQRWQEGRISLQAVREQEAASAVRNSATDVGIVLSCPTDDYGPVKRLRSEPMVCVMPVGHRLSSLEVIEPQSLSDELLVGYRHNLELRKQVDRAFAEARVEPQFGALANYTAVICGIVEQGYGLAVVDPFSILQGQYPRLLSRPFKPECMTHVDLILSERNPLSLQAARFVEIVQECLGECVGSRLP